MKTAAACTLVLWFGLLCGCNPNPPQSTEDRKQSPGEAAGHAAYEIQKDAKKAAKEAAKDIKSFARDAREGFQDAKQKDATHKKAREDENAK